MPWTMYFHEDFALHGAYWHDGFGRARSHGCVNLAPADAKTLYEWAEPRVPPGWSVAYADEREGRPGSVVRVRRGDASVATR